MIHCTINSNPAYPSTSDKIKLTFNNPYIQDSGTYTYEISFPMSIYENQMVFGHLNRFDVHKRIATFDDCKLYADNRLFISGKGTVTSVTDSTVKIQIVGGMSRIKYNAAFESHFINNLDYSFPGDQFYGCDRRFHEYAVRPADNPKLLYVDLRDNAPVSCFTGIFCPVYDDTNDRFSNLMSYQNGVLLDKNGVALNNGLPMQFVLMQRLAIQPRLSYVLETVLQYEGYESVDLGQYSPLIEYLYIASAHESLNVAEALPHWSVYKFLDEISKLLNASFLFDDVNKTVTLKPNNTIYREEAVAYECLDEYTAEYDEEGNSDLLSTSNIGYAFDDAPSRSWRDSIPIDVQKHFDMPSFGNDADMATAAAAHTERQRRETIYCSSTSGFHVYAKWPQKWDSPKEIEQLVACGFFSPVVRDFSSSSTTDINIVPASVTRRKLGGNTLFSERYVVCPAVCNDFPEPEGSFEDPDTKDTYASVQETIEAGSVNDNSQEEEDSDDSKICLFFRTAKANFIGEGKDEYTEQIKENDGSIMIVSTPSFYRFPVVLTDFRAYPEWCGTGNTASLDLRILHGMQSVGQSGELSSAGDTTPDIDTHNLFCIKFLANDIPDPAKIFIFHARRFVCQKLEIEIADKGVNRLVTGYFYEIL